MLCISCYSSTHKTVNKRIIKSSVTSKTTNNFTHIYASTSKHANTIMSTKFTNNTLYLSIVVYPRSAMTIQITLEKFSRSTSERIEIFSTSIFNVYAHPMASGFVGGISVADQ